MSFVPYKRTFAKELKSDGRFVEACQFYGLSISEGIIAVKQCPKIGCDGHGVIWRKEQGFDEPKPKEPEKFETGKEPEVEEVE